MNDDAKAVVIGLSAALAIFAWWFYMHRMMQRDVEQLGSVMKRGDWQPYGKRDQRYKVEREWWPYRTYRATMAFLRDRIDFGSDTSD